MISTINSTLMMHTKAKHIRKGNKSQVYNV